MRKHLPLFLLIISTIAALGLSGFATFEFFREEYTIVRATFAVGTFETGILAFMLSVKPRKNPSGFIIWLENASAYVFALGLAIVVVTANVLYSIDILQVAISQQAFDMVQVIVFGIIIPLLPIPFTHRMVSIYRESVSPRAASKPVAKKPVAKRSAPKKSLRKERLQEIRDLFNQPGREGITVDEKKALAKKYGVRVAQISKDVREIQVEIDPRRNDDDQF